jgi:conjugative relaxase-like TrwC/TraI family protein
MGRRFGAGQDPVSGAALVKPYREGTSAAGFDMTFSVPKSVSVLWALGDERTRAGIVEAHHQALAQTLGSAEREVVRTRISAGGASQVPTRGTVAAAFDHYDSRAGDPQLHARRHRRQPRPRTGRPLAHAVFAAHVPGSGGTIRDL